MEKERNTLEAGKKEADLFLSKEREHAREQGLLYQFFMHENDIAFEKVEKQNQKNEESLIAYTVLLWTRFDHRMPLKSMLRRSKRLRSNSIN